MTRRRKLVRAGLGTALVLALWLTLHTALVAADGLLDEAAPADVAVVLGSKVELTGAPSERLAGRLDRAVELYRQGLVREVLVSGGLGAEGFEEADVMAAYLIARQVPAEHVVRDREGYTTFLTAVNARRMMGERGHRRALVVSDYFHLTRCKLAFRRAGVTEVRSARARFRPGLQEPRSLLREFAGYYSYALRAVPAALEPAALEPAPPRPDTDRPPAGRAR